MAESGPVDSAKAEPVDSSSNDDESAMRTSVVAHESCLSALDSNRAVVKWALPVIGLYQDSLATERASIPYQTIGVSGGTGLLVGYILGKIF